eukprot:g4209.t1
MKKMERSVATLAHDYLNGEITRQKLVGALRRMAHEPTARSEKAGSPPRRMRSLNLWKRRLEATIGCHFCELWPTECSRAKCSRANFQNETLQYRAFEDPLQRTLADGNVDVVQDVLGRIAHRQDAALSHLVASQKQEIEELKSSAMMNKSSEEALLSHCEAAIISGSIDKNTPAAQALARVLKHCRPKAFTSKMSEKIAAAPQSLKVRTTSKKSGPNFLFETDERRKTKPTNMPAPKSSSQTGGELILAGTRPSSSAKFSMRPEEWVRQQRLKNASTYTAQASLQAAKISKSVVHCRANNRTTVGIRA